MGARSSPFHQLKLFVVGSVGRQEFDPEACRVFLHVQFYLQPKARQSHVSQHELDAKSSE